MLYSTGHYISYLVITYNGKFERNKYIIESLCYIPETNIVLQINYTSIKKLL